MPPDESEFLDELKAEVEMKLGMARASRWEEEALGNSPPQLFDPAEVEREQAGLRNVLGAIDALQHDPEAGDLPEIDQSGR